jgi:hypothetical protein
VEKEYWQKMASHWLELLRASAGDDDDRPSLTETACLGHVWLRWPGRRNLIVSTLRRAFFSIRRTRIADYLSGHGRTLFVSPGFIPPRC